MGYLREKLEWITHARTNYWHLRPWNRAEIREKNWPSGRLVPRSCDPH